jgi:hypothetical protein
VVVVVDLDFGTVVDGAVVVVLVAMTSAACALCGVTCVGAGTVGASV